MSGWVGVSWEVYKGCHRDEALLSIKNLCTKWQRMNLICMLCYRRAILKCFVISPPPPQSLSHESAVVVRQARGCGQEALHISARSGEHARSSPTPFNRRRNGGGGPRPTAGRQTTTAAAAATMMRLERGREGERGEEKPHRYVTDCASERVSEWPADAASAAAVSVSQNRVVVSQKNNGSMNLPVIVWSADVLFLLLMLTDTNV